MAILRASLLRLMPIVIAVSLLLAGCGDAEGDLPVEGGGRAAAVPELLIIANDPALQKKGGLFYRNDTLFSGIVVERYGNGEEKSRTPYFKGKEEGVARGWYQDGSPMFERRYVAGKREGIHRSWWPDGTAKSFYTFRDDVHEKVAEEWFPDGTLYRRFHYEGGQESGSQRMWNVDGTLRANYVVVQGRRYGSMGEKPCISTPFDSLNGAAILLKERPAVGGETDQ